MPRLPRILVVGLGLSGLAADARATRQAAEVDYATEVLPILVDHCYACHGPDAHSRQPRSRPLRFDRRDDALAARADGAALVPGDAEASTLWHRIVSDDPREQMPPPASKNPLEARERETLRRWIEQGANYGEHWAFVPPRRPSRPAVEDAAWARNDVDLFVRAGLEAAGESPAPRADPRRLVRRLSFDLRGLPPSPEEVDAFAADPSDAAFDALIESMLASVHHAERLTTFWFDLVRYADTTGIHADNPWHVHPYRDWVIDALHRNMPFDQFTREQLAGDLLPNATQDQKVAAAYNRLNLITREGGSQPKEFLARYTADRVRNASEVWLAMTLGCAECHDHKFDPLSAREFYEFGAFFADIEQRGVYSKENVYEPEMKVPSPVQSARGGALRAMLADVDAELDSRRAELATQQPAWERERIAELGRWQAWIPTEARSEGGAELVVQPDGAVLAQGAAPATDVYRLRLPLPEAGLRGLRLELMHHPSLPENGPGRAHNGNLVLGEIEFRLGDRPLSAIAQAATAEQEGYPLSKLRDGKRDRSGWALLVGGRPVAADAIFEFAPDAIPGGTAGGGAAGSLEIVMDMRYGTAHTLGHFRWSFTRDPAPLRAARFSPLARSALGKQAADRREEEAKALAELHFQQAASLLPLRERRRAAQAELDAIEEDVPDVLLTRATQPMTLRVLPRGNWMDDSGEVVQPQTPAVLGRLDITDRRATRLDLANWLVDGRNPLTARVLVNRLWRLFFDRGIVRSLDDFGTQGRPPTHPELLDHLAAELVDSGWDLRHVIRQIVGSRAYQQDSRVDPARRAADPENDHFARQARFRLAAEFVRDQALAASGLLVRTVGGPSVFPYQPAGHWSHLNFPRRSYEASEGEDLYRRALYNHWQRQYLNPSLAAFDAPSRERCVAQRTRSNTPQAALVRLNDPIFVEAARALAAGMLASEARDDEARVRWAWRQVLQREPRPLEQEVARDLLARHRAQYREDLDAAKAVQTVGAMPTPAGIDPVELAAFTSVARVLLNLHETITRS